MCTIKTNSTKIYPVRKNEYLPPHTLLSSEKITVTYSMGNLPYLQYFTNADLHTETQI